MQAQAEIDAAIDELIPILAPIAKHIEDSVPTTKDHYGDYMVAITTMAEKAGNRTSRVVNLAMGMALIRSGASQAGVQAALRVMGYL